MHGPFLYLSSRGSNSFPLLECGLQFQVLKGSTVTHCFVTDNIENSTSSLAASSL